jgi:protein SCO1/2
MSRSFEQARELLLHKNTAPTNWQFLSISFDTDFDQPAVIARYAQGYRRGNADHWLFATAPTATLDALVPQLDFRFSRQGGSLIHNLRTVVLDPQGRLYRQFDGNRWTAAELAQAVEEASR